MVCLCALNVLKPYIMQQNGYPLNNLSILAIYYRLCLYTLMPNMLDTYHVSGPGRVTRWVVCAIWPQLLNYVACEVDIWLGNSL